MKRQNRARHMGKCKVNHAVEIPPTGPAAVEQTRPCVSRRLPNFATFCRGTNGHNLGPESGGKFPTRYPQEPPVGFVHAGLKPRNSTRRFRCPSVGRFWFFSHFSMAVSVIPKPSILASCVMDSCISTLFF